MRVSTRLLRTAVLAGASALATVAFAAGSGPASAAGASILVLEQASGIATGPTTVAYNTPGVPLLDHFFFRDVSDDQHLLNLTARPRQVSGGGVLDVAFSDNSQDEQFEYRIAHQRVSSSGLSQGTFTDTCSGQCTRAITRPAGDVVFVITGFDFEYTGGDHHMDSIGIIESGGQLTHWFNDRNNDDEYDVTITYVWVPRSRFSTVSSVSGTAHAVGSVSRTLPAGEKVIRGFNVDNIGTGGAGDNHIKRFGFLTNSTSVDIYYGDNNPADSADWTYQFNYAILA